MSKEALIFEINSPFLTRTSTFIGYSEKETAIKKERARAKSDLRRTRNKLSAELEEQDLLSRREVQDACSNTDSRKEIAMEIMASISDIYIQHNDGGRKKKLVSEMKKLEDGYYTASETARVSGCAKGR